MVFTFNSFLEVQEYFLLHFSIVLMLEFKG